MVAMGILQAETLAFHIVMHNLRMPVETQAVHIVVVRGCMFEVHLVWGWCTFKNCLLELKHFTS